MRQSENGTRFVSDVIVIPLSDDYVTWLPIRNEGGTWEWTIKWNVSEKHWLKCGEIIPENSLCQICGER